MIIWRRNSTDRKIVTWRGLVLTLFLILGVVSTSAFTSTQVSGATSLTRGIIVQEISIHKKSDNTPVAHINNTEDYKLRVLVANNSHKTKGFYYLDVNVTVIPLGGGAEFYSNWSFSERIRAYTSPSGFTLKPGQSKEIWVPARFSQAGRSKDKRFNVVVAGAEILMTAGAASIRAQ